MIKNELNFLILIIFIIEQSQATNYLKFIEDEKINYTVLGISLGAAFFGALCNARLSQKHIKRVEDKELFDRSYSKVIQKSSWSITNELGALGESREHQRKKLFTFYNNCENSLQSKNGYRLSTINSSNYKGQLVSKDTIIEGKYPNIKNDAIFIDRDIFSHEIKKIINEGAFIFELRNCFYFSGKTQIDHLRLILKALFIFKLNLFKGFLEKIQVDYCTISLIEGMMNDRRLDEYVEEVLSDNKEKEFDQDFKKLLSNLSNKKFEWATRLQSIFLEPTIVRSINHDIAKCFNELTDINMSFLHIDCEVIIDNLRQIYDEEELSRSNDRTVQAGFGLLVDLFKNEIAKNKAELVEKQYAFALRPCYKCLPVFNWFNTESSSHLPTRMIDFGIDGLTLSIFFILLIHKYEKIKNFSVLWPLASGIVYPLLRCADDKLKLVLSDQSQKREEEKEEEEKEEEEFDDTFSKYCKEKNNKGYRDLFLDSGYGSLCKLLDNYLKSDGALPWDRNELSYVSSLLNKIDCNYRLGLQEEYLTPLNSAWGVCKNKAIKALEDEYILKQTESKEESKKNSSSKESIHSLERYLDAIDKENVREKAEAELRKNNIYTSMEKFLRATDLKIKQGILIDEYLKKKDTINYEKYFKLRATMEAFENENTQAISSAHFILNLFSRYMDKEESDVMKYYYSVYDQLKIELDLENDGDLFDVSASQVELE